MIISRFNVYGSLGKLWVRIRVFRLNPVNFSQFRIQANLLKSMDADPDQTLKWYTEICFMFIFVILLLTFITLYLFFSKNMYILWKQFYCCNNLFDLGEIRNRIWIRILIPEINQIRFLPPDIHRIPTLELNHIRNSLFTSVSLYLPKGMRMADRARSTTAWWNSKPWLHL